MGKLRRMGMEEIVDDYFGNDLVFYEKLNIPLSKYILMIFK